MKDSKPLRIAVNAFFGALPLTGSGQYLDQLLSALRDVAPWCSTALYRPDSRGRAVQAASGVTVGHVAKLRFEQLGLPSAVAGAADVLHYPYWAAPLRRRIAVVVTVHDVIPAMLASYRGPLLARAYTWLAVCATRRATMLIADSQASKRDIVARLGVPPERVRVVYLAADPVFRQNGPEAAAASRDKYRLAEPFLFYVGGLDRRKNVERLIESFARSLPSLPGCTLAIAGDYLRKGPLFPDLTGLARRLEVEHAVKFLGIVPAADLPGLYHGAAAVAFPSYYEGFGLPPLEALACGTPVLCSNASSLPEVVGDAAVLLDPFDTDAWAAAIVRVVRDAALAAELRRRGPRQAVRFSWRDTALATADVYQEAMAQWHSKASA